MDAAGPPRAPASSTCSPPRRRRAAERARPYLAFAVAEAEAEPRRRAARLPARVVGRAPSASRRCRSAPAHVTGPLGRPFSARASRPRGRGRDPGRRRDRGRAALQRELSERGSRRVLLGFPRPCPRRGLDLFRCSEVRTASEDGHTGHRGYVTDLLAVLLEGMTPARRSSTRAGPRRCSRAVRELCAAHAVPAELALETPMACGFESCPGCAVPLRDGGYMQAVRGWPGGARGGDRDRDGGRIGALMSTDLSLELCGIRLEHPILNGSGTFDAIAARRLR